MNRDTPITIGIVFDFSLRHFRGKRLIDLVKKEIIQVMRGFADDDFGYFYQNDKIECEPRSKFIAAISAYEPYNIDLELAMKQTMYIVAGDDSDNDRFIIYLSDRYSKSGEFALRKIIQLNNKDNLGCGLVFCGVGDQYDKNSIQSLEDDKVKFFDFETPDFMGTRLLEFFEN